MITTRSPEPDASLRRVQRDAAIICVALVVFASWRPWRTVAGAYLFGAISILAFTVQTFAWGIPSQFLSMLPYLVTIIALVVISGNRMLTRANTPACLGQPFVPDR